jgi:electron transport complex protein RnfE
MKKSNKLKIFLTGLINENPTLVIFLGMCPALGTTNTIENACYMSLCVIAVLILSNIIISLIRNIVPNEVRIPVYIIIIATLVSIIDMIFHAYLSYDVYSSLGSFISLIVVNCIILGRAEAFASKNKVVDSFIDACGYGLGFAWAIICVAFIRELVGTGCLSWAGHSVRVIGEAYVMSFFATNPGAFITLGIVVALYNVLKTALPKSYNFMVFITKKFINWIKRSSKKLDKDYQAYEKEKADKKALETTKEGE